MISRVLVANRGEIALRIIRACKELGIETVAIFSEADRGAQYLELADQAICVGPAKSMDSYLRVDRVIAAAEVGNVDAIRCAIGVAQWVRCATSGSSQISGNPELPIQANR